MALRLRIAVQLALLLLLLFVAAKADSPYRFLTWNVTYGTIYPLGVPQQGILINEQFPGPDIHSVTNDNLYINVFNSLDEPFLISWNGVQNRRNSYEDGVYGTTCPISPKKSFTVILQVKDQNWSFYLVLCRGGATVNALDSSSPTASKGAVAKLDEEFVMEK